MSLGSLQQMAMLAVARLGDDAFAKLVQEEIEAATGRELAVSTVYVTLVRLDDQGLVTSESTPPDPLRGGRGKRFFRLTPAGWSELRHTREVMARLWEGVEPA